MPKKHIFYGIAAFVIIGIFVGIMSYATDTRKMSFSKQQHQTAKSTSAVPSPVARKKSCGCCADRITRLKEQIHEARRRRSATQKTQGTPESMKEAATTSQEKP